MQVLNTQVYLKMVVKISINTIYSFSGKSNNSSLLQNTDTTYLIVFYLSKIIIYNNTTTFNILITNAQLI